MSRNQFFLTVILSSFFGALVAYMVIISMMPFETANPVSTPSDGLSITEKQAKTTSNLPEIKGSVPADLNFVDAADKVIAGVVHISSLPSGGSVSDLINPYRRRQPIPSGSGVILTVDGYIATNNHVVEDAGEVRVTLYDNRSFVAKVIGTDLQTDLALLKIDAEGLDFIAYGNSDEVAIGEWVLAVGNPFNLNSTVTAGIVSAKARNIRIFNQGGYEIESFIQTDAAVNPGNSGGALVNLQGELVGVNTAIATRSGSYEGYSFAVPVSLVRKVMDDLLEFGSVQRGLLGVEIRDVNAELAESEGLNTVIGVYVATAREEGAAAEAGIQSGDVIIKINEIEVRTMSEMQELVARHRPGDEITVTYIRDGETYQVAAELKNYVGSTELELRPTSSEFEGVKFENISESERAILGIRGGARVDRVDQGKWKDAGLEEGFIVTHVDKVPIDDAEDLRRIMMNKSGGVLVEGVDEEGNSDLLALDW